MFSCWRRNLNQLHLVMENLLFLLYRLLHKNKSKWIRKIHPTKELLIKLWRTRQTLLHEPTNNSCANLLLEADAESDETCYPSEKWRSSCGRLFMRCAQRQKPMGVLMRSRQPYLGPPNESAPLKRKSKNSNFS